MRGLYVVFAIASLFCGLGEISLEAQKNSDSKAGTSSGPSTQPALQGNVSIVPGMALRNGKPVEVLVRINAGLCDPEKATAEQIKSIAPLGGNGVTVSSTRPNDNCSIIATLAIDPTAFPGTTPLLVHYAQGKDDKTAEFDFGILDAVPGPIPPGIAPQVDVMWTVLPRKIVKDTFGGWIWKKYYSIEVVIGNNSGYDLQVAGLGFMLRNPDDGKVPEVDNTNQTGNVPTNDYHIVRSTVEREQTNGARALVLNSIQAAALIGSGVTPFFHNLGHRANFTTGLDIASDPLGRALNFAWPDNTITQLNRLDNLSLHDSTIIPNNNQTRTVVYVARDTLNSYFQQKRESDTTTAKRQPNSPALPVLPCAETEQSGMFIKHPTRPYCNPDNPQDIKHWLGNLILVGNQIEYHQRIHITSQQQPQVTAVSIAPTSFAIEDLSAPGAAITLSGDQVASLASQIGPLANGTLTLNLDDAKANDKSRTGKLALASGATPLNGAQNLSFPYSGTTANLTITLYHRYACGPAAAQTISKTDLQSGNPINIPISSCSLVILPIGASVSVGGLKFTMQGCTSKQSQPCVGVVGVALSDPTVTAFTFDSTKDTVDFPLAGGNQLRITNFTIQ
jgi:hypothetical protein